MANPLPALVTPWAEPPGLGAMLEVAPRVFWARMPLPMTLDHVNVYAIDDAEGWTIIDTGISSSKSRDIWKSLLVGPMGSKPIKQVIVTHHHPDHVGLAGWFQTEFGADLWMTRTAWLMARMLRLDPQERPSRETLRFWQRAGMPQDMLNRRAAERPFNFCDMVHPMPLGFQRLQDGAEIQAGGRRWRIHIGHGHAPEHATLWSQDDGLILAGDQIISSISSNLGVYATEPEADTVGDWLESCQRFKEIARADHLVLSGHKLPFIGLPTRLQQLIDNHHSALNRLRAYLITPASAYEVLTPLFKRAIKTSEYGLALGEAVGHLNHLYQLGKVTRHLGPDGAYRFQTLEEKG